MITLTPYQQAWSDYCRADEAARAAMTDSNGYVFDPLPAEYERLAQEATRLYRRAIALLR